MRLIDADATLEQMKGMNMLFSPKIVIDNMPTISTEQIRADALNIDLDTPMHFTPEQKAWIKKYISINGERQRLDGAKEFAEWLCKKSDYTDIDTDGFMTCLCGDSPRDITIEQALKEWQKGKENEIK